MYDRLIGQRVKVVFKDGDKSSVTVGRVEAYDDDLKTLQVLDETKNRSIYINANGIDKLEVLYDN